MKTFKIVFSILLTLFIAISFVHAKEIVTSVEISNSTLTDPLQVTDKPYNSTKQDFYEVKVDTVQFTKVEDLDLGDRIQFQIEDFDFKQQRYVRGSHNIVMASVKPNDALVYIYSEPMQTILFKGVVKDFDLTGNGQYDLRLRYDGMDSTTGLGILNIMRYNHDNYKIYGNTFCERTDRSSEFKCVEVIDKNLGLFKELELDKFSGIDNDSSLDEDEKLVKKVEESLKENNDKVNVTEPVKEETKSFMEKFIEWLNIKVLFFIGILVMLVVIFSAWRKHVGKGGAEINFED